MSLLARVLKGRSSNAASFETSFSYRSDDVVIVSYPKSGSTWVRFILANLLVRGSEVDFLTAQLRVPELSKTALEHGAEFAGLPSPRFMRTHAEFYEECPRVIYLLRDGRDVMVSFYHHFRKFYGFTGSFLEFLEYDKRPSEWDRHVESWIFANPLLERVCLIRYESLLSDAVGETMKMLEFGGLRSSAKEVREAVAGSSFEKMKTVEQQKGLGYVAPGNKEMTFVRQGGSGHWREWFGDAEKQVFKERFGKALVKTGYERSMLW